MIAGTPSRVGVDPSTVRVRNVTSNSFEIQIDEWNYLNPVHPAEVVSYLVVEAGQYQLDDGTIIVAGNQTGQDQNLQTYSLGSAFDGLATNPIVLTSVVTASDPTAVTTRVIVDSNSQFRVRLQEEESADGVHGEETVSYFAIQPAAGATGGLHYNSGTFSADHTGQFVNFDPGVDFSSVTSFFAGAQTASGGDPITLRNTALNAAGVDVFLEEEKSRDNEIAHGVETVGFFAINRGLILGESVAVDEIVAVTSAVRDEGGVLVRPDLLSTYTVSFGADVSVSADHLEVRNDTLGGTVVDTSGVVMNYDSNSQTATWDFSSLSLDAGYYTFELSDAITTANGGSALDGDNDGTVGENYSESIYVAIPGDANLDGDVEINEIDIFVGNTGDGATVLSNLGRVGTFVWSQGDFNGDSDVDSTQLDFLTGVQGGDYAIFLENVGRNVRPSTSQSVASQPAASQPLVQAVVTQPVVSQPVVSESITVDSVSLQVPEAVQANSLVLEPIESFTSVVSASPMVLTSPASEVLDSISLASMPPLSFSGTQANVDTTRDNIEPPTFSVEKNSSAVLFVDSALELQGANELIDGFFSEENDRVDDDFADDSFEVVVDVLGEADRFFEVS